MNKIWTIESGLDAAEKSGMVLYICVTCDVYGKTMVKFTEVSIWWKCPIEVWQRRYNVLLSGSIDEEDDDFENCIDLLPSWQDMLYRNPFDKITSVNLVLKNP